MPGGEDEGGKPRLRRVGVETGTAVPGLGSKLVNIAVGNATAPSCIAGDTNRDGVVRIAELVTAVNRAVNGCRGSTG